MAKMQLGDKGQAMGGEQDNDDENQPLTKSLYKKGEYLLHILIEQTRALQHAKDSEKTIDPLIKIECMDKTKYSSSKKGTGLATTLWNEHFHFTKSYEDGRALQNESVRIYVLDHRLFGKNAVVGQYELDFSTIFLMNNHVLQHKWLGLFNPEVDFNKLTGYIKVSINLVGQDDKQTPLILENSLKPSTGAAGSDQQSTLFGDGNLLLPPHISTRGQQLRITLIKGDHLMKMDAFASIDPFVTFECGSLVIRNEEKMTSENPEWMIYFYLPLMLPSASEHIIMRLYDYDRGMKDEIVGCSSFKLEDIRAGRYSRPFWENIYGAPRDGTAEVREYLCSHSELGTQWAGRIKLELKITDCEEPIYKLESIQDDSIRKQLRVEDQTFWDCFLDIYYILNCPVKDGKYQIKLRWADFETKTAYVNAQNGVCEFYKTLQLIKVSFPYTSSEELPDVFIYLLDDDKPICYRRFKFKEVIPTKQHPNGLEKIVTLLPDKSIKNTDINQTGILKIRIGAQPNADKQQYQILFIYHSLAQFQPPKGDYVGKLFVNLFQASDMLPSDDDGSADPKCEAFFYNLKAESFVCSNSISPVWNQQLQVPARKFDSDSLPPIILRFFDQDKVSIDFLGQCIIDFHEAVQSGQILLNKDDDYTLAKPLWTDILVGNEKAGRVLVSFNFFEKDPLQKFSPQISPKCQKHFVKIKALGFRNLKSFGVLPVTKAFLKIDVKSIRRPEDANALAKNEIITQPKEPGANPNIQSIIVFEIMLPDDVQYMPSLQCFVHDYVLKGLYQPIIGTFPIDLHTFKLESQKKIKEQLDIAAKILFNPEFVIKEDFIFLEKDFGLFQEKKQEPKEEEEEKKEVIQPKTNQFQEKRPPRQLQPVATQQIELMELKKKDALKPKKKIEVRDRDIEKEREIDPEYIEVLKQFNLLIDGSKLNTESVVKYVKYKRNEDEGTMEEVDYYPEEYFIGLGFDTQQQKSNLFLLNQSQQNQNQEPKTVNATSMKQLDKEINEQNKMSMIGLMQQQQVHKEEVKIDVAVRKEGQAQQEFDQVINGPMKNLIQNDTKSRKHYRFVVPGPLEKSIFMSGKTFDTLLIKKGSQNLRNSSSMADVILGSKEKNHVVGKMRGWIEVVSQQQLDEFQKHPAAKIMPQLLEFRPQKSTTSSMEKELIVKSPIVIRVYVIDCFNLPSKDFNSESDPFISVQLGDKVLDNADQYQTDQSNPQFYKMFQITTELPGPSDLVVSVYDYDDFKSNELLGETTIDIEERYFQKRWRQLKNIPIETRQLYHPSSSLSQGVIRLFVEIINQQASTLLKNPWYIAPRPPMNFELRVVIWDAFDVPCKDVEETSDIYVTAYLDENDKQKTDTHYRSFNGRGSFNWRMKFPVKLPIEDALISFQIFDKDVFSPDDFIADCTFDFTKLAQRAFENEINVKALGYKKVDDDGIFAGHSFQLMRESKKDGPTYEKIELKTENVEKAGYKCKSEGKVVISLELVPETMQEAFCLIFTRAKQNPVGKGRADPNHSPFLPAPTGRMQWSMNPMSMLHQILGPRALKMLLSAVLCILISYLLIIYVPIITGDVIAGFIVRK